MTTKSINLNLLLHSARKFDHTTVIIKNAPEYHPTQFFIPLLVNEAFAIELYLKAVYAIENNDVIQKGHELEKLYRKLSKEAQEEIRVGYDKYVTDSAFSQSLIKNHHIDLSFDAMITANSEVFVKLRYLFETTDFSLNVIAMAEFKWAIRDYIKKIRPE